MHIARMVTWGLLSAAALHAQSVTLDVAQRPPVAPTRRVVNGILEMRHDQGTLERAPLWTLEAKPLLVVGGVDDPNHDLTYADAVDLMADGSVVTLSGIGSHLFWFPANGRGARELSRQGSGPGELMAPSGMAIVSDTIVVYDPGNHRMNWFSPSKGLVANAPWPDQKVRAAGFSGSLRGGQLIFTAITRTAGVRVPSRLPTEIVVASPRARSVSVVGSVPNVDVVPMETRYRGRRDTMAMVVRFTRFAQIAPWDTVIATSGADGYRIDLRSPAGKVLSTIVLDRSRRPVTAAMRDSAIAVQLRQLSGPSSERMVDPAESRRLAREQPSADSLPPYGQFFVTRDRSLWVADIQAPGDKGGTATAFRQDGAILARLTWTGSQMPMAFGVDRVVMREVDDDGVVSLKVYRIRRGQAPS